MQGFLPQSVTPEIDMDRTLFWGSQFLLKFLILCFKVFNSIFKDGNLLVPIITDKLEVLYSVIKGVSIYVVNYLPTMKASTKMFCHNKAMFSNITFLARHWIKEVIWANQDSHILSPSPCPATSTIPTRVLCSTFMNMMTLRTPSTDRFTVFKCHPTFFSTSRARNPDIPSSLDSFSGSWTQVHPFPNFAGSSNFSQYRHTLLYNEQSKMSIDGLF